MQQLTGLDAAFLYLETDSSPMHIGGISILDAADADGKAFTLDGLKAMMSERLHVSRTFTQKLADVPFGLGRPYWIEDPDFDIDRHVEKTQLPEPGGMKELRALVAWELSQPMPRDRPLWHLLLVEGLDTIANVKPGSLALISKIHHAAIDGVSGSEIMAALFDPSPTPRPMPKAPPKSKEKEPSRLQLLAEAGKGLVPGAKDIGSAVGDTLKGVVRSGATWAFERVDPPPMPFTAPRSVLNGTVSSQRVWDCVHLDLARIRAIRKKVSGTVNDVVLTICAGALRQYLQERGELPDQPLVAMCPISVRSEDQKGTMGNQVSGMLVSLATDIDDPKERLEKIMAGAYDSKVYNRAVGARTLTDAGNMVPFSVAGAAAKLYSRMHLAERHRPIFNLVVTNVPGPQIPLYVNGAPLRAHVGMGPIFDGMGLILPVFSYAGRMSIGVTSCPDIMPDPDVFTAAFPPALDALEAAVG